MSTEHSPYFNPAETISRDELLTLQNERLKKIVRYAAANNDVYRDLFAKAGVDVNDFNGIDDIQKLPIISKETFRQNYPIGLCCTPKSELREMHMSSGSTGTPVVMPYTQNDLLQWADCMARCYRMAGAYPSDPVQITPSFGLFNGGFGMYHGARLAELFVIPTGSGNTERQIRLARDFGTKFLTAVVSYSIRIIEVM
ncbi:MAG: hypothetical protein J6S27_06500, partial [Thermoguttaceae bacterium]|nr:hypothetical protein [Thermoguttaceae bacterium]